MIGRRRLATAQDVGGVCQIAAAWLAAGALRQDQLPGAAARLASAVAHVQRGTTAARIAEIDRRLRGRMPALDARRLYLDHLAHRYEHLLGRVLDMHGRWSPVVEVDGAQHLTAALAHGRGAVLWTMSFCGHVVTKIGLWRTGFAATALSAPNHGGFSDSWLAVRVLNRWATRGENPYLAGRVVIPHTWSLDHLRKLMAHLRENRVITIAGEHTARGAIAVEVLGTETMFATGAPGLARSTGAALLTAHAHREGPNRYVVTVDPLALEWSADRKADLARAVHAFAGRLERCVVAHAADWDRWSAVDLEITTPFR